MAIRFIWPFQNSHGRFEMASGFKTASNIPTFGLPSRNGWDDSTIKVLVFKQDIDTEAYIKTYSKAKHSILCQLRIGILPLEIELGL